MNEAEFTVRDLRKELELTLAQMLAKLQLRSIGALSDIERGEPCSVSVALAIEALSGGRIAAASLSRDVALVDAARALDAAGQPDAMAAPERSACRIADQNAAAS